MSSPAPHIAIIGAGIGGLAAALRLAHQGVRVTVLERHASPGGKMRQVATQAGPADAGPTVLTMKPVFEALFADVGEILAHHVTLKRQDVIARHFWPDGTTLDLMHDPAQSKAKVGDTFGAQAAREFAAFNARTRLLYDTFDGPVMQSSAPSAAQMTAQMLRKPRVIAAMAPHQSLARTLSKHFSDPRLAQLFARYATYVGGLPAASPSLLSLIWQAESAGVWHVDGGMHALAKAIEACAVKKGAAFRYDAHITRIETQDGRTVAVHTQDERIAVDAVLFNGDTRALTEGTLGPVARTAVPTDATTPRSLSASVMAFAATPKGPPLSAHNVFFADDPGSEYSPLALGAPQTDPTLYVCAQDRFGGQTSSGIERFEVILNSPPLSTNAPPDKGNDRCHTLILNRLKHFGLTFSPTPDQATLTTPQQFDRLFPASSGSLYGRSPHGLMAAFKRPTARTALRGLYLVGGGAHPGAGVPMATLSARHAVEAIMTDLRSTSTFRPADTHGGMSTASATTEVAPSRSLVS